MGAYIAEEFIAEGTGSSKQKAEQEAAIAALKAKNWENYELQEKKQENFHPRAIPLLEKNE